MMMLPRDPRAETIPATQLTFPAFGMARKPTVAERSTVEISRKREYSRTTLLIYASQFSRMVARRPRYLVEECMCARYEKGMEKKKSLITRLRTGRMCGDGR